jgi:redox-sensitive bicupin YhaK (pirin superfamily)
VLRNPRSDRVRARVERRCDTLVEEVPMITVRPADERGRTRLDWLDSRHTFSFNQYHDPQHMGFRSLRVINEDLVVPGAGFGTHGHRDMEILSYVLEGGLEHKDSMGTGSVIRPGDVQKMRAGTGVTHSERNASSAEPVHFLQIWIVPAERGLAPAYEQRSFTPEELARGLRTVASGRGDAPVRIHQDAELLVGRLGPGERRRHELAPSRHAWVQVARGAVDVNGRPLRAGDGAAVSDEAAVEIASHEASEVLVFDLA